jgi:hypothetical protein
VAQLYSNFSSKVPTGIISQTESVEEYIKTLDFGYTHIFRTYSDANGNPGPGSTLYIVYIINKSRDAVGLAISHGKNVYHLQLNSGTLSFTKVL